MVVTRNMGMSRLSQLQSSTVPRNLYIKSEDIVLIGIGNVELRRFPGRLLPKFDQPKGHSSTVASPVRVNRSSPRKFEN